jgi:hypothetical protein
MKKSKSLVTLVILGTWAGLANAQYVVVLKNGRQLTVQSYREEGSTVKIQGLGGELGIPKEQIQSISKSGQSDRPGLNVTNIDNASRSAPVAPKPTASAPARGPSEVSGSTDANAGVNADEEREYRQRLAEVTQKLESARTRYLQASSAGNTGAKFDKEGIRSWTADLASRIQDSQKAGGGPADTPLAWSFPAPYTPKAKELSDMRMDIDKLEKERNDLVQEMKSKNIEP